MSPSDAVSTVTTSFAPPVSAPTVRADGRCASCQRQRRTQGRNSQLGDLGPHLARDPFCSTECCKVWYGVKISGEARSEAQMDAARSAADRHRHNKALHRTAA